MKLTWMLLLIALPLHPPAARAAEAGGSAPLGWLNWNQGISEASITKRPILVDVYTDWCGWCKRMDRDVYSRDDVRAYLNQHFILVRLNAESADEASFGGRTLTSRALAQQLRVSGYPTTIFLKANGDHIANVPGYVPADRFKLMLQYIGEDHIGRGVSWQEFEKSAAAGPTRP
jgi:thioredoxin-related protein